ncbi:hypothetical protein VTN77DRAFT_4061 [Rasamsonia byssochlamydoides]|uniref:uncharacterized protein n=1 Tax=Rasamsonia byssochlamydoides TaxID=89139 RepID=UPI0037438C48
MDAKTVAHHRAAFHPKSAFERVFPVFTEHPESDSARNDASSDSRKPRKAAPAAGRSTLFWVNSDPQSVKAGSREEMLKRIRSHVMSEHNRKKRLENTRRYNKSKTWKNLAYRPPAGSSHPSPTSSESSSSKDSVSSDRDDSPSHSPPNSGERVIPSSEIVPAHSPRGIIKDLQAGYPVQDWVDVTTAVVPWSYVGHGMNDPFDSTRVQLSDRQFGHLQFFLHDLISRAVPFQTHGAAKLRRHWASLVQDNPAPLYACITSSATNKALISGDFFADPVTQMTSPLILDRLHHRGETIKLVNQGLSNPATASSDALIAAVSVLISIEIAFGNPEHIKIHLNGLRKMVALRQNFSDIAAQVREQIEWTDIRSACSRLSKPIFPFIRYARPAHVSLLVLHEYGGSMASRLLLLAQIPGFFGDEMSKTIHDLLELTLYSELAKTDPKRTALLFDEEVEDYFNNEVLYVEYSLINDRYTAAGQLKGDDTIEGTVRLACILFHNTAIWGFYPEMAAVLPQPVLALERALRSGIAAGQYDLCQDLLIWLLFIGACSAKFIPQRWYFINELAKAVRAQELQTFDKFRSLLSEFFYVDRCYLSECRDVWAQIHTPTLSPHQ